MFGLHHPAHLNRARTTRVEAGRAERERWVPDTTYCLFYARDVDAVAMDDQVTETGLGKKK